MTPTSTQALIDANGNRIEMWFWACDKTGFVGEIIAENGEPILDALGEFQVAFSQYELPFRLEEVNASPSP